ncbi:effector binding domain-containing protein [Haemophilus parahaemolyticus]|uniref:GyrI-like domain-containing protein n=1 Tax=Haemophilus parahaemolyticus TaxID=735 RepID=UPI0028D4D85F|nr:effector binding domain-containing protein [Haemophilus parahaemolyticus]MDU4465460.1 effector binding domain-containing protein [Haemophilus parahaemolyticus]
MPLTLYPFATIRTHNIKENTAEKIGQLWQNNFAKLTKNEPYYGVYLNYESDFTGYYDVAVAQESKPENSSSTIEIEDLAWYEIFPTTGKSVVQTWQHIWNKEKQGLLKRAYKVDFEKYYPNGKVDIYISIRPHC